MKFNLARLKVHYEMKKHFEVVWLVTDDGVALLVGAEINYKGVRVTRFEPGELETSELVDTIVEMMKKPVDPVCVVKRILRGRE